MPTLTPNLSLTLYDKVTDNNVLFIDFRDALAGLTASNMVKIDTAVAGKQAALVSGTNIKTINNTSILGSGNVNIGGGAYVSDTPPVAPIDGQIWADTSTSGNTIPLFSATSTDIKMNGIQALGISANIPRADHVHPTDTSRQPLGNELTALQALTDTAGFLKKTGDGTYTIDTNTYTNYSHPTTDGNLHVPATGTTNNGKILTAGATAGSFSWQVPAPSMSFTATATDIKMNGTQAVGVLTTAPRADHVHPSDTAKATLVVAGSAVTGGAVSYNGTTNADGYWHGGATAPTGVTQLNYSGYLYATRVYNAIFNDLAEFMEFAPGETLQAGDVLSSTPWGLVKARLGDKNVVGVYSDTFGYALGAENQELKVPVGISGRVKVRISNPELIEAGALLVASDNGYSMISEDPKRGTVIGKVFDTNQLEDGRYWMMIALM